MELSDQILKHYPDIDEKRVGIGGGSYGGFMATGWKAHRPVRGSSLPKIHRIICPNAYIQTLAIMPTVQGGAYPWEDFEKVWSMSPLKEAPERPDTVTVTCSPMKITAVGWLMRSRCSQR